MHSEDYHGNENILPIDAAVEVLCDMRDKLQDMLPDDIKFPEDDVLQEMSYEQLTTLFGKTTEALIQVRTDESEWYKNGKTYKLETTTTVDGSADTVVFAESTIKADESADIMETEDWVFYLDGSVHSGKITEIIANTLTNPTRDAIQMAMSFNTTQRNERKHKANKGSDIADEAQIQKGFALLDDPGHKVSLQKDYSAIMDRAKKFLEEVSNDETLRGMPEIDDIFLPDPDTFYWNGEDDPDMGPRNSL
jgi:hypothetical protein